MLSRRVKAAGVAAERCWAVLTSDLTFFLSFLKVCADSCLVDVWVGSKHAGYVLGSGAAVLLAAGSHIFLCRHADGSAKMVVLGSAAIC
jgi:hypothetical protein